jgi:hypothetical protein
MGKAHDKRYIIEVYLDWDQTIWSATFAKWQRSLNEGLTGHFPTRELAQAALDAPDAKSESRRYRIRSK